MMQVDMELESSLSGDEVELEVMQRCNYDGLFPMVSDTKLSPLSCSSSSTSLNIAERIAASSIDLHMLDTRT